MFVGGLEVKMANFVRGIIGVSIGIVVFANLFMYILKNTSTTTWSATEVALWALLGIIGITGMFYGIANLFGLA